MLAFPLHVFVCLFRNVIENWDYLLSVNHSARMSKNYFLLFPLASFRHFRVWGEYLKGSFSMRQTSSVS